MEISGLASRLRRRKDPTTAPSDAQEPHAASAEIDQRLTNNPVWAISTKNDVVASAPRDGSAFLQQVPNGAQDQNPGHSDGRGRSTPLLRNPLHSTRSFLLALGSPATQAPRAPELPPRNSIESRHEGVGGPSTDRQPGASISPPLETPRSPTPSQPASTAEQESLSKSKSIWPKWGRGESKIPNSLCDICCKIDFAQFGNTRVDGERIDEDAKPNSHLIKLEHLLRKRQFCSFCRFLFQALCLPSNDPLRDEELQRPILEDKRFHDLRAREAPRWVAFRDWAVRREQGGSSEAKWPFGATFDDVALTENKADKGSEVEVDLEQGQGNNRIGAMVVKESAYVGLAAGKQFDDDKDRVNLYALLSDSLRGVDGLINLFAKNKVPAAVRVVVYPVSHPKSGVLEIGFFGCPKAMGRNIKMLSYFTARVASPLPSTSPGNEKEVCYGRLVDSRRIDLKVCHRWLRRCCSAHGDDCSAPKWSATLSWPSGIPFRLIDVQEHCIVKKDPEDVEYAALSYVWGADVSRRAETLSLTPKNIDSLLTPGSLHSHELARVIKDTMDIVRALSIRYLWTDRLCIIQEDGEDKSREINQMDRVYGGATVTVVAASGASWDESIPGVNTARSVSQLAERVSSEPEVNVLLPIQSEAYPDLMPWAGRAWTLQEKLLSKRLLIFHDGTVDFRCPVGTLHEDMSARDANTRLPPVGWLSLENTDLFSEVAARRHGSGPRLLRSPIFADYAALIQEYTPRKMTDENDAVNAIMGMLKILIVNQQSHNTARRLLHGLPEEFFDQALHWQPAAKEGVRLKLGRGRKFPSWSWAAWETVEHSSQQRVRGGGVEYEATYGPLQTDNDGRLQKVLCKSCGADAGEERMRPLLRWHIVRKPPRPCKPPTMSSAGNKYGNTPPTLPPRINNLRPLNGTGLGLSLSSSTSFEEWSASVSSATNNLGLDHPIASLPTTLTQALKVGYHLVFRTLVARFTLGETRDRKETLWRRTEDGKSLEVARELSIRETAMLNVYGKEVGRVVIPHEEAPGTVGEFLLLSEAQFFGDEESIEVGDFPLFNVMMVTRVGDTCIRERVALGKVTKEGWWGAKWSEEVVVLG
ncbi:heterokaryon incompatibility protein-domain-containing protein [Podospora aff. communis PSN243]|uniref:Heterokaryon incompatibility protein-domain-containing protein n=1 Tax=Podospora aff. communis PSN243 TaxID=3040156 RepID=A0AAV9GI19_9PEZI|nr:heterokaryon incompatibility protein-domain-containing protein [Podospora aff. communis PSN243]